MKEFILEYRTKGSLNKKTLETQNKDLSEENFEQTEEYAKKWYQVFNEKYFDGILKMPPIKWRKVKNFAGKCTCYFNIYTQKIVCEYISLNKNSLKNFKTFRNTLVHEMCHQWQHEFINEEIIQRANTICNRAGTNRWWEYLGLTQDGGHAGRWLDKANELNSRFKELNITKMNCNETINNMDDEGNLKQEYINEIAESHLLAINIQYNYSKNDKYITFVNENAYNKLINDLKEGYYKNYYIKEYKFDPNKAARYGIKVVDTIFTGYNWSFLKDLIQAGAVDEYDFKIINTI